MSKVTNTKLDRMLERVKIKDRFEIIRKQKIGSPQSRLEQTVEYSGVRFNVLVSPGQLINKRKAFKREMERRTLELSL